MVFFQKLLACGLLAFGQVGFAQPACDRLSSAISNGDTAAARQAIQAGCGADTALDASGATALMWARSDQMVRALLQAGASADHRNEEGTNALGPAAYRGDAASVQTLIAAGARADVQGLRVCGPLCEAVGSERASSGVVRSLLEAGASVNAGDCWNRNAMFAAGIAGKTDILGTLLERPADVNVYESFDGNPLIVHVAQGGSVRALEMLVRKDAKLDWPNAKSCGTALHAAARRGHLSAVQKLVELGADIQATDSSGKTARGAALETGQSAVASYLQARGAPSSGTIRSDCISVADLPEAADAWQRARQRTRAKVCAVVVGPSLATPSGSGRSR